MVRPLNTMHWICSVSIKIYRYIVCQCCRNTLHESTIQLSKCLNGDVGQMCTLEAELSML